jgi:hypothetical protein
MLLSLNLFFPLPSSHSKDVVPFSSLCPIEHFIITVDNVTGIKLNNLLWIKRRIFCNVITDGGLK